MGGKGTFVAAAAHPRYLLNWSFAAPPSIEDCANEVGSAEFPPLHGISDPLPALHELSLINLCFPIAIVILCK
jgi:hypothetical protein